MKIAAVFFNKKNREKGFLNSVIKNIFNNINITIYVSVGIFLVIAIAKHISLSPKLFYFATNFRQADEKKLEFADLYKMYGIYNGNNYIWNNEHEQGDILKANNENQSEFEVIDNMAKDKTEQAVFGNNTPKAEITENSASIQRITIDKIKILNYSSSRNTDFESIINSNVTLTKTSDKILLYNTHTSESYANSDKYQFPYSGARRSQDATYNMISVAAKFSDNLETKGIHVVQDTTPHDYGTYTSSYSRSRITVKNAINKMGGTGISIDVHRDAIADLDFRPVVKLKNVQVAQCMFVIGAGSDTTPNPYYLDNLRLAIKIQRIADEIYPGLFRPMIVRDSVYNQDLNKYSLLIEVGASGNTLDEVYLTTRCIANLFNIIYKD